MYELFDLYFRKVWVIFLMTSVFSFWLQADNLEFGHINQVFLLLSTPVIFLMPSVFLFCLWAIEIDMCVCSAKVHRTYISMLRVDHLEFPHINQVLFFSLQLTITVSMIQKHSNRDH